MVPGPEEFDPDITTEELLEQGDRLTASSKALISDIDEILRRGRRAPAGDDTGQEADEERRPGLGGRRPADQVLTPPPCV